MISSISDLLKSFIDQESKKLDEFELKHGPTIGKMYEGLTSDVLNKTIPQELNLKTTTGVIYDDTGLMTGEIDCMLVRGEGIQIPYTESCKWHIKDVIAVLEVKKTLYSAELKDSFTHLKEVLNSYSRYVEDGKSEETYDITEALRAFSEITSIVLPSRDELGQLDLHTQMIYHTLVTEHISPIRIVLGYHGFKSENSLRKSLVDFMKENLPNGEGFGVGSFPQLIISGDYSLIKINGQPYSAPYQGDEWIFYASSRSNPILLILELIWSRLSRLYDLPLLWGDDLELEAFVPLLRGKVIQHGERAGWTYNYDVYSEKELSEFSSSYEWEPCYLSSEQFTILNRLCVGEVEKTNDPDLISFIESKGESFDVFLKNILETGLVGLNGDELQLITQKCQCVILPNGKFAAAENNSGRLTRWLMKNIIKK